MKTNEELLEIIHDNEFILPADSNAHFVFLDKEQDEVIVELNVLLGSPYVSIEGEIINPNYQQVRKSLRLKLKLSDFFMVAPGGQAPQRDINYTMQKLEEALRHQCSWATGKHDEECDIVSGLNKELKEARDEMFDLYHQACYVGMHPAADESHEGAGLAQYDNQCMSCYEYAEEKLIEWGLLKPEQCLRRPIKTELLKDAELKIPVSPTPVTPEWADEEKKK